MADVKKIATRESYGNTLKELAAEGHEDLVVLDADLAAATKTGMFRKAYPDRHFDCGIAEENMMGVAAGLSTMGYVPFVSSFAMFAAGRALEHICILFKFQLVRREHIARQVGVINKVVDVPNALELQVVNGHNRLCAPIKAMGCKGALEEYRNHTRLPVVAVNNVRMESDNGHGC